jgi:hypothetical protein
MGLQLDHTDMRTILFRDQTAGAMIGQSTFVLHIECADWEERLLMLSEIGLVLKRYEKVGLAIETNPDDFGSGTLDAQRTLLEKKIKAGSEIWEFHKADADQWPSPLHGHNVERPYLKIDAISGAVYDINTRQKVDQAKPRALQQIQTVLLASKDFKDQAGKLFPSEKK